MPVTRSVPTVASIRPKSVDSRALTRFSPASVEMLDSPSTIRAKFSAGPKTSAQPATGSAKNISATTLIVPAMNEPIAAMASAGPARPQQREPAHGPDAGQHADERADERADEGQQEVDRLQRDAEPEPEVLEDFAHRGMPSSPTGKRRSGVRPNRNHSAAVAARPIPTARHQARSPRHRCESVRYANVERRNPRR